MGLELMLAYGLDLLIGDPPWIPHPVRAIGCGITIVETWLRRSAIPLRLAGAMLTVLVVTLTCATVWLAIRAAAALHPYLGDAVSVFLVFLSISVRSLGQAGRKVSVSLENADIVGARRNLGEIVSRDTAGLSEDGIIRGTVETVAENTVDGVISPLFYAVIGGAPLAWAYKAVNTLDSMIGYKNARYLHFGWFAARLDDAANFIPARLSALIVPLAALLVGQNAAGSFKTVLSDGRKAESPNAGFPEAAFAGALAIQLGGRNVYQGRVSDRPLIGRPLRTRERDHIRRAIHLMYASSLVAMMGGTLVLQWLS